jgi:hypothetical protein
MKLYCSIVALSFSLLLSAQFGFESLETQNPIDSAMLWIEDEVKSIDNQSDLTKVLLPDSLWNKLSFSDHDKIEVEYLFLHHAYPWDTVPQAYMQNGELIKMEYSGFTFHFSEGQLIRSMAICSQSAGWSRCNGYTSAQFFWYYNQDNVYREMMIQQYEMECWCNLKQRMPVEWVKELYTSFEALFLSE